MGGPGPSATVTLDAEQAEQILGQLAVCVDVLAHSAAARAELHDSMIWFYPEPVDVDRFVDELAFHRRYLDARLAAERHRALPDHLAADAAAADTKLA